MYMTGTLYEKLGGEEFIFKVVDYFYGLVLKDNTVIIISKKPIWTSNVSIKRSSLALRLEVQINILVYPWQRHTRE